MNIVTQLSRNIENIRRFVQKYFLPVCHNHSFKKKLNQKENMTK